MLQSYFLIEGQQHCIVVCDLHIDPAQRPTRNRWASNYSADKADCNYKTIGSWDEGEEYNDVEQDFEIKELENSERTNLNASV